MYAEKALPYCTQIGHQLTTVTVFFYVSMNGVVSYRRPDRLAARLLKMSQQHQNTRLVTQLDPASSALVLIGCLLGEWHVNTHSCMQVLALVPRICHMTVVFPGVQLAEKDAFDDEKDAASVAYNAAVKGAAKVSSCQQCS